MHCSLSSLHVLYIHLQQDQLKVQFTNMTKFIPLHRMVMMVEVFQ